MHQLAALVFEDVAGDGAAGMQGTGSVASVATLLVTTAIDDAGNLAPAQGTGTHGAGLYGDVEGAVGEVLAAQLVGSHGDGLHLGMGGDVVKGPCRQRLRMKNVRQLLL